MRSSIALFFAITLAMTSTSAFSQEGGESSAVFENSMQDVYIIAATAAGGAILGLSTLSFVDEPSEHLKNVIVGGAIGLIVGVGIVAWREAGTSRDFYKDNSAYLPSPEEGFTTSQRIVWHHKSHRAAVKIEPQQDMNVVGYQFKF